MKKIILLISVVGFAGLCHAQNPYYATMKLIESGAIRPEGQIWIDEVNADIVLPILAKYMGQKDATYEAIYSYYSEFEGKDGNPFIEFAGGMKEEIIDAEKSFASSVDKAISAAGSLDVTTISQGLSLFLISRAKEELNIAFFQRFKKFFDAHQELRTMFPKTSDRIVNLLEYQYAEMLPVLQKAFQEDMENLPENMIQTLLTTNKFGSIEEFPELIVLLKSYNLIRQFQYMSPLEILDTIPSVAVHNDKIIAENLYSFFKLSSIFSDAVRSDTTKAKDNTRYWVTLKEFQDNILSNPDNTTIFVGLLYQQIKLDSIAFNKVQLSLLIDEFQKTNSMEIEWYNLQLSKFILLTEDIDQTFKDIMQIKSGDKKPAHQDIYNYLNTLLQVVDYGFGITNHYSKADIKADKYIEMAREMNNLYLHVAMGDYTVAMNSTIRILETANESYKQKHADKKNSEKTLINKKVMGQISTYGVFIANVADAKTPEQVQTAIETAALPAGSSSYKKYHRWNLTLNGYLGANYNFHGSNTSTDTWSRKFNLSAPVGLNLSFAPMGKGGSFSLYAPVIDIGAIVNYQLTNDSIFDQKIYLSNIFSPGGYVVYGFFGNVPLSLGLGGQYGPGLVKIEEAMIKPEWRWNIFLVVDIPIFNITRGNTVR